MEFLSSVFGAILPHWPFLVIALIWSVVAQILKVNLFTPRNARKWRWAFWGRRALPVFLLLLGGLVGAFWPGETSPGISATLPKIVYFMGAACVSIVGYNVVRTWVKRKYDLDVGVQRE